MEWKRSSSKTSIIQLFSNPGSHLRMLSGQNWALQLTHSSSSGCVPASHMALGASSVPLLCLRHWAPCSGLRSLLGYSPVGCVQCSPCLMWSRLPASPQRQAGCGPNTGEMSPYDQSSSLRKGPCLREVPAYLGTMILPGGWIKDRALPRSHLIFLFPEETTRWLPGH